MKLLIVTAWYHPFIHPRAHRWTALAEHWAAEGHEVHLLTSRHRGCPDSGMVNGVRVERAGFDSLKEAFYYYFGSRNLRGRVGGLPQKPGKFTRLMTWIYNACWKKIYFPDDACLWYFPAKKKAKEMLDSGGFDLLITVSLPFTGHLIGLWNVRRTSKSVEATAATAVADSMKGLIVRRTFKSVEATAATAVADSMKGLVVRRTSKSVEATAATDLEVRRTTKPEWIADIGDPFSIQNKSQNNAFLYGRWSRRLEQQVLESADAVAVTTEFTLQKYREQFGESAVAKMHVIPPLLHPAPDWTTSRKAPNIPIAPPDAPSSIKIGYFGALYAPFRTPDAFLDLLDATFEERPGLKSRLEVHFYGEVFPEFYDRLRALEAIQLHGLRSRAEIREAMQSMDILLNIGNTTDYQLPSKSVEYLAAGIPIVNLSYTTEDPFAAFLKGNPLMLNLKVQDGKVRAGELRRWLEWLEEGKKTTGEVEIRDRVKPYRVEAIARQYLTLLNPG